MMTEASIFIEGQAYGSFTPGVAWEGYCPNGLAFFCPYCARIWATIYIPGEQHQAVARPCLQHHDSPRWPGGSIWINGEAWINDHLPPAAIQYEFLRTCDLIEQHPEIFGESL